MRVFGFVVTFWLIATLSPYTALSAARIKNIVFDIDGVFLNTSETETAYHIGTFNLLRFTATTGSVPTKATVFEALKDVPAVSQEASYSEGLPMPQILVDWQTGKQSNEEILRQIDAFFATSSRSRIEKVVYRKIAEIMLDQKVFMATRGEFPAGIELLTELRDLGQHNIYFLSNWDRESFPAIVERYENIFSDHQGIMISGDVGTLKPSPLIFQRFLDKFALDPAETLFIDDEPKNLQTAQEMGFQVMQCTGKNYGEIKSFIADNS